MRNMEDFRSHDTWMVFKIMGEFVEGFETLRQIGPAISMFGSARMPRTHPFYKKGMKVAELLSKEGFSIISGGGPGLMEAANRGARKGKGKSVGLNIRLPRAQKENPYAEVVLHFDYFFARKVVFARYASGYIVLPGGYGTMDEFFEALTLIQTHKMTHFPIVLMGREYWHGMLQWLRTRGIKEGTISHHDLELFHLTDDPLEAVRIIVENYKSRERLDTGGERENGAKVLAMKRR
ncbi:MAG: Rossman fold protein, TIGR00730 family [Deltaproteobacteria bacterium RBG_13_65_10]|nr:MAG: Rossman fold protein, TIGR00730 family [Deltaproteobacteria bacterium RBG_13_65_10]